MLLDFRMKLNFSLSRRLKFYRTVARATDQRRHGVKVIKVLESLVKLEEANNNNKPTLLSKFYSMLHTKHSMGTPLGEVLNKWVPAAEAVQIYSAEKSGRISQGFEMAYTIAKQQSSFVKVFRTALVAPISNLLVSFGIMGLFFQKLIPQIANSVPPDKRSSFSNFVYSLSHSFGWWMPALFLVFAICFAWIAWALPNYNGSLRLKLDKLPPFSMYKLMIGCSFLYALNSLMKSNVAQRTALQILEKFANPYLKKRINKIQDHTSLNLGDALIKIKMDFPDKEVINELAMASMQGNVAQALPDVVESLSVDGLEIIQSQALTAEIITKLITFGVLVFVLLGMFSFIADMQTLTLVA